MPSRLRSRVWLLAALLLATLLLDAFVVYLKHRADAIAHFEQDFRQSIRALRARESEMVAHSGALLKVMGEEAIALDAAGCGDLARRLLRVELDYRDLGVVRPDGRLLCSGRASPGPLAYRDQAWFREAVERREMSRGHFVPDGIVFALPVRDSAGTLRAVVYAETGTAWLRELVSAGALPLAWEALIAAPDGTVLFPQPAAPGGQAGSAYREHLLGAVQAGATDGLREMSGMRQEAFLYGVATLASIDGEPRLAIGVPKAVMLAGVDRDFRHRLLALALAGIVAALVGWLAIQRSVETWARSVHESLRRFGAGERSLRLPAEAGIRELRQIDAALNRLFETVEASGSALSAGRRLSELELRQRTEELAALLEAIPTPVWMARDGECREIVGNRAANRLYGTSGGSNVAPSPPEPTQSPCWRHYRPDGTEFATDQLPMQRAVAEARSIENCEIVLVAPDGGSRRLFGNTAPLFDDDGKVRGAVAAFVDITRLRTMDEAWRRNEMVLAQAEKLAHVGAWSFELAAGEDIRASACYWSDEAFRLLGYAPGEVVPGMELFLEHVHPDDHRRIAEIVAQPGLVGQPYHCEFRIVRRDGAERILLVHGEFRSDSSGRATHFIGACRDVTEQRLAERELFGHRDHLESLVAERTYELAVAKEAAERANRAKSQFLANISHELRTPLNSLMLLAHVLADNAWGNLTPQQAEYARVIELSGRDLMHLIDELLDLGKIEAGRLDIHVKPVPFPDIMQNVHRIHRHLAQQKGLDFKMEIAADVPAAIFTDPLRVQQLLRKLLSNAIKFTHAGGITLRIRRAVSGWRYANPALGKAEAVIAFDVVDSGVGIPPEQQHRILDAFEQRSSRPVRQYEGSGLGLTLSSEIAALLGGELAMTSVPGQGSTFTLFLPLAYLGPAKLHAAPADAVPDAAAQSPRFDPVLAGKTVLVVDDDRRNRFALAAVLEERGMRVVDVPGGAEALETLACDAVDVVLMDIMMPVMDGYQTIRAIRSGHGRVGLPVIALTADAMPATREKCLAAGASDYLAKPVDSGNLLNLLRKWLGTPVRQASAV